jgi:predicted RecB family nuclease
MRLIASDFITHQRPSPCDLRVWLRYRGEPEREPSIYDEVLHRLGERHEREHLATLASYLDLSQLDEKQRLQETSASIVNKVPVLYQPAFRVMHMFGTTEAEILGIPDFMILDGGGYIIRDAKIARRIDEENHPEILLQVQLYGWLFENSVGAVPKALQVFNGMQEIVTVPYDGGAAALAALEHLLAVKRRETEAYEPVGWSKCGSCGFNRRCWNKAEANDDVALVPDVDQHLARKLNGMNVRTRKELLISFDVVRLSELKRPFGNGERRVGSTADRILQFAEAMEKQEEKILAIPAIPQHPNYVMFDLEGMPPQIDELDKIYLWGAQVFGDKPSDFMPAVSGFGPNGDKEGWLAFLENAKRILELYGDIRFVHWASYEKTCVLKYIHRHGDVDGTATRVVANLLDLFTITKESIVLPVPSFSLKVIERYVGYKREQDEYGGQWAMAMFIEATETSDERKRKQLMDKIIAYNREDLEATWAVFQWLRGKVSVPNPSKTATDC